MKIFEAVLEEIVACCARFELQLEQNSALEAENSGLIRVAHELVVQPGQYFQVWRADRHYAMPVIAFPASLVSDNTLLLDRIPADWNPGEVLHLSGPHGNGFSLAANVTSLAEHSSCCFLTLAMHASRTPDPLRLLPLITQAIAKKVSVSLFMDLTQGIQLSTLPPELEVQGLDALPEALSWAEYLYIDMTSKDLDTLRAMFGKLSRKVPGQVLIRTGMPLEECFACAGVGDCGVCAVDTKHGQKLACKDGPVFKLEELVYVV